MLPELDKALALTVKTDWGLPGAFLAEDWPTASQMKRYLQNVRSLLQIVGIEAPLPGSMTKLTWEGANQIEKALLAVRKYVEAVKSGYYHSGEFYSGEETIL